LAPGQCRRHRQWQGRDEGFSHSGRFSEVKKLLVFEESRGEVATLGTAPINRASIWCFRSILFHHWDDRNWLSNSRLS
jgi:hypothetical protein